MIDWTHVALNALWITGCAIIVTAFSYIHWLAHIQDMRLRQLLGTPEFQLPFYLGLSLITSSLLLLSDSWLERGLWAVFVAAFFWQSWALYRGKLR